MAYSEVLANRIRVLLSEYAGVEERKMFGGLCFMLTEHMCCGIVGDMLMARVGLQQYEECLRERYAREMDFTGKSLKGMIYVLPKGIDTEAELKKWIGLCVAFVHSLPPKKKDKATRSAGAKRSKSSY